MPGSRRVLAVVIWFVALMSIGWAPSSRIWRAAGVLLDLGAASQDSSALVERELSIPGRNGPIRARLYRLTDRARHPGLVVSHGVHYQGIDERRLVPFARSLARAGLVVVTPQLDDLADYRISARGIDTIKDSASWLVSRDELLEGSRVGLLGFSFAGGLSLVAASEPELAGRVAYVTSVGGHHDLSRVLRFLVSDELETPQGIEHGQAHEYGLVVLVYSHLDRFVPEADRVKLGGALRAWLREDRPTALALAAERTTPEGERLFDRLVSGRLKELRPELERLIMEDSGELARLSPRGRLRRIGVPVYLLHGAADNVIPPSETRWAELELEGSEHEALVSPLLEHVELGHAAAVFERVSLVRFMAHML